MKRKGYPVLDIHLDNIHQNAKSLVELCEKNGVSISGVIKGLDGSLKIAEQMMKAGCKHIASSRLEQLIHVKKHITNCETMLLRLPMLNEIRDVVKSVDISLNSEFTTICKIEKACEMLGKTHNVVLMMDLGDLREGFIKHEELLETAEYIETQMKHVKLAGIGTNLGCYGSIKPTIENLGFLSQIAEEVEARIGRPLEIISGGATTTLPLLQKGHLPRKINNLRIGEGILNNMDLPLMWGVEIPGLNQDTLILKAQIIEVKDKPSHPIGEIFVNAFGHTPQYDDMGIRKRALLAIGAQDFAFNDKLVPIESGIRVIGSSSDHLIIDITDSKKAYKVGDLVSFRMFYAPMLFLSNSNYVRKRYIEM